MSEVNFEEEQFKFGSQNTFYRKVEGKGLSNLLISSGLVKSQKGANALMIVLTVLSFSLTLYLLYFVIIGNNGSTIISKEEMKQREIESLPLDMPDRMRARMIEQIENRYK